MLLFIILCVGLVKKWKYSGALLVPIIIAMEVTYYDRLENGNYIWHMIILLVLAIFIALYTFMGKDGE